jgi:hypothetical protein
LNRSICSFSFFLMPFSFQYCRGVWLEQPKLSTFHQPVKRQGVLSRPANAHSSPDRERIPPSHPCMEDQLLTLQTCLTHVSQSSHLIVALYFRGLSPDRHTPGLTSRFIKRTRSIPTSIMLLLPHLQAIATIYSSALLILPSNPHTGRLCWLFRDS